MPTSSKPRKKYRPNPAGIPLAIRHDKASEIALQLVPHSELEKLREGTADESTFHTLACRLNWGYVMSGEVFDSVLVRLSMEQALNALQSIKDRHQRIGKWGASGEELKHMGDGLNFTDEMQKAATRREQLECLRIVYQVNQSKQKAAA